MPSINVKMVKVAASDLTKNDIFTLALRGDGPLYVVTAIDKKEGAIHRVPFDRKNGAVVVPDWTSFDTTVRKVVGVKYAATA